MCAKHEYIAIYLLPFLSHSSSVAKIGISVMSSAAGDNKLVEEPITSRWQALGSGLSTCHYLHIDISKSLDRPFLRLPWQATMINPGKIERGEENPKTKWKRVFSHTQSFMCTYMDKKRNTHIDSGSSFSLLLKDGSLYMWNGNCISLI